MCLYMIKIEFQDGKIIYLTDSLEKDYLLTIQHEEFHKKINNLFCIDSKLKYAISYNDEGKIIGSGGFSLPLYPFYENNYIIFFKYIFLELFQLIYEFLFALFFKVKELRLLKEWILTFCMNLISIFPRKSINLISPPIIPKFI